MDLDSFESRLTQVEGSLYGSAQPQALYTRLSNIVESHKSYNSMTHEIDSLMTTFSTVIMNKRTSIDQLTQRIYELIQDKSHIEQLVRSVETILAHEHVVHPDYDIAVLKYKEEIEMLNEEVRELVEEVSRQSEALDLLLQNYENAMEITSNLFIKWEIDIQNIQSKARANK